jgi:hypothetical protein
MPEASFACRRSVLRAIGFSTLNVKETGDAAMTDSDMTENLQRI